MQVPSHRFGRPTIQYGNTTYGPGEKYDSWNTRGKEFYKKNDQTYDTCVLHGAGLWSDDMRKGVNSFQEYAGPPVRAFTNYSVARINYVDTRSVSDLQSRGNLETAIDQSSLKHKNIKFLLLLLQRKDATAYARFKDLADRKYGYHSICMTERIFQDKIGEKMGNIMMKANLKTEGSNHTIAEGVLQDIMKDTLVLGADVTHPNSSSIIGCPSIAAIVGSVDDHAGRFLGSMRLQSEGKKEVRFKSISQVLILT
jgi:eukaryotic translation initiation factor 2C